MCKQVAPYSNFPTKFLAVGLENNHHVFEGQRNFETDCISSRAYLLTQIRSGHCWLSTYGKLFGFRDDDRCLCGERESIIHVLLDCPLLRDLRRELREKVGDALNSMSVLLGGSCQEGGSRVSNASRTKTVEAVLDFAEASQRFRLSQ